MSDGFEIGLAELRLDPVIGAAIAGPYEGVLGECVRLTRASYLEPRGPFTHPWLDIGPGYAAHPCFGHWDIVHECFNLLAFAPRVVREQMEMYLSFMDDEGHMPGTVYGPSPTNLGWGQDDKDWYRRDGFRWSRHHSHPPVWPELVDEYFRQTGDRSFLAWCLERGQKNLAWWQKHRRAPGGGFYYLDVVSPIWESGVDEGVRFLDLPREPRACIDATCHLTGLMKHLQGWADVLGLPDPGLRPEIARCEDLLHGGMWDAGTGFFYDLWMTRGEKPKIKSFEGFSPLIMGLSTSEEARRLVEHVMNPSEFFGYHPVATVAMDEPTFALDCWRGPTWNSMTFWIVRALQRYGFAAEARAVGERALWCTQEAWKAHGCIFEFYNSTGPDMAVLRRKKQATGPFRDYLGHAPLIAMYEAVKG